MDSLREWYEGWTEKNSEEIITGKMDCATLMMALLDYLELYFVRRDDE